MAGIDASIYAQFAPKVVPLESPQNMLLKQLQIDEARQSNMLNQQKLDAYTQGQNRTNKLREMLGQMPANTTDEQRIQTMRGGGYTEEADKLQTTLNNQRKTSSEADERDIKTAKARLDMIGAAAGIILKNPNAGVEEAHAMFDYLGMAKAIPPDQVDMLKARIAQNPQNVRKMAEVWQATALDASKQLPTSGTVDLGNRTVFTNTDPLTGAVTQKGELAKGQSPDNAATQATAIRGQDMRASESAGQNKVPMGYRQLPNGDLQAIPGGPADAKTQALDAQKAAGATDVDSAIAALRDAYTRLEKGGGITSTNKDPISNLASSISSSTVGQMTGRALGTNNQSARNDIAMTRPALLAALMKATGMSAKQMDSNAELKLWMTTATDPTLDVESNRRALDNIERKYLTNKSDVRTTSQDSAAESWARANPNDPRSAQILKHLGR